MSKPWVSFIIPTYNALPYLKDCLESIERQDYPRERIEVIVIDGGSQDGTRKVARKFGVRLLSNPRRVAEYGKSIGIQAARGELVVLLDADNVIAQPDWLRKMVQPLLEDPTLFGVESCYLQHPAYTLLNRYLIQLHVADPFAYALAKFSGVKPVGANGFVWRRSVLQRFHTPGELFREADLAARIIRETGQRYVQQREVGIYHFHVRGWRDFVKKRYRIAREFLNRSPRQGQTWAWQPGKQWAFFLAFLYELTFIGPLLEGVFRALHQREVSWILHPVASWLTVAVYSLTLPRHLIFPFSVPGEMPGYFLLGHHTSLPGAINHYENLLVQQSKRVIRLSHPLRPYPGQQSFRREQGRLVKVWHRKGELWRNLPDDLWLSLREVSCTNVRVFVGADNFSVLVGILARKLRLQKIPRLVYLPSGFAYRRFNNRLMNWLYLLLEQVALWGADLTVSNTQRAAKAREGLGLKPEKSRVIPNGVRLKRPSFEPKKINPRWFIYVGQVNPEHGLLEFLAEMENWIKKLVVIGDGPQWHVLERLREEVPYEVLLYHRKSHEFVIEKLQDFSGFGLAPYSLDPQLCYHTYFGSPLKVKEYLSCGLPVVLAKVPEISNQIEREGLGVVYPQLDASWIIPRIQRFPTADFHLKAEKFYNENRWESLLRPLIE